MNPIVKKITADQLKTEATAFSIGDSIRVHTKVVEGEKERIQIFSGVVIARKGSGLQENFTVRRISYGEGVERVFPIHSPRIEKIEIEHKGRVRRAKLYYLRDRIGKGAMKVRDLNTRTSEGSPGKSKASSKSSGSKEASAAATSAAPAAATPAATA
jgi:large subunit ribosomal protein L19